MRTWTRLILALLLILPFTPALLRAAEPDNTSLKAELDKLHKSMEKLQSDMTANSLRGSRAEEELREARKELGRIRELLERMDQRQETLRIQSGYNPRSVITPNAPPTSGTILVQNVYSVPATVNINGRTWRVEPNQTLPITGVPAGTFQYSVDVDGFGQVAPPRMETLRPAGYRINIFPLMSY